MSFKPLQHNRYCNYCSYDGASDLATAEFYNPLMNTWTSITPMGTKRSCLGLRFSNVAISRVNCSFLQEFVPSTD